MAAEFGAELNYQTPDCAQHLLGTSSGVEQSEGTDLEEGDSALSGEHVSAAQGGSDLEACSATEQSECSAVDRGEGAAAAAATDTGEQNERWQQKLLLLRTHNTLAFSVAPAPVLPIQTVPLCSCDTYSAFPAVSCPAAPVCPVLPLWLQSVGGLVPARVVGRQLIKALKQETLLLSKQQGQQKASGGKLANDLEQGGGQGGPAANLEKGVQRLMSVVGGGVHCVDKNVQCKGWASKGECVLNPRYMLISCSESCGVCARAQPVAPSVSAENEEQDLHASGPCEDVPLTHG